MRRLWTFLVRGTSPIRIAVDNGPTLEHEGQGETVWKASLTEDEAEFVTSELEGRKLEVERTSEKETKEQKKERLRRTRPQEMQGKMEFDQMYQSDALLGLQALGDESVDLFITDPPYDTLEKWRAIGTTTRLKNSKSSSNKWFRVVDMKYLEKILRECYRILKRNTHFYLFCDFFTAHAMSEPAKEIGFEIKKPLVWNKIGKEKDLKCQSCGKVAGKTQGLGSPGMGYPYRSCYEMVLFLQKGKRKPPENKGVRDVQPWPGLRGKGLWPTQKPVELIEVMIGQSSFPGDLVVDPFAGSGSTLVAAEKMGRRFLGYDLDPKALDFFESRTDRTGRTPLEVQKPIRKQRRGLLKRFSRSK